MSIPKRRIITPRIITTEPGGRSRRLLVAVVLLAVWTWASYQFGRDGFDLGIIAPPEQVLDSGRKLERLRAEYKTLKSQAEEIGKTGQEMSNAQKMAEDEISRLQDERMSLIKQVSTLTESIAANKLQLDIKGVEVSPGSEPGSFEYRVIIEPLQGVYGAANGMLKLAVTGESDGNPVVVNMSEDDGIQEDGRRIFGLHQYLRGTLKFSEQFAPKAVNLELITGDDTANPLAHNYEWSDVLTEQQSQQEGMDPNERVIDDLRKENLALVIKMAKQERAMEKAKLSAADSGDVKKLEQEKVSMTKEIEQLKQMVSELSGKLKIKAISLKPKQKKGSVEIGITVTRTIIDGQRLNGVMTFSLAGQENGEDKVYPLEQLTSDQKLNYKLGFKNYQEIKEPLLLPKGFTPQKIIIHVKSENIQIDDLNEEFDWPELAGESKEKSS